MIKTKTEHDMKMEVERLELEKDRLELDRKREERLLEEGRRRDELQASQAQTQTQLLSILSKLIDK